MTDEQFDSSYPLRQETIRTTYGGKYWFDEKYEGDAKITRFEIAENGTLITTDFEATNIIDLTDYRPLARFLRWLLRR